MNAAREIAIGTPVELAEPADRALAGARGGITDVLDGGSVIVELTSMPPEPIVDRIVVTSPEKLRVLSASSRERSSARRAGGRICPMTAKEKLLERVMKLSEDEADETLRLLDAREGETVDEWGELSKVHEVSFGESMQRLAGAERAAGHKPW